LTLELLTGLPGSLPPFEEQEDFDIGYIDLLKEERIFLVE